jgi:hypothetical protein
VFPFSLAKSLGRHVLWSADDSYDIRLQEKLALSSGSNATSRGVDSTLSYHPSHPIQYHPYHPHSLFLIPEPSVSTGTSTGAYRGHLPSHDQELPTDIPVGTAPLTFFSLVKDLPFVKLKSSKQIDWLQSQGIQGSCVSALVFLWAVPFLALERPRTSIQHASLSPLEVVT